MSVEIPNARPHVVSCQRTRVHSADRYRFVHEHRITVTKKTQPHVGVKHLVKSRSEPTHRLRDLTVNHHVRGLSNAVQSEICVEVIGDDFLPRQLHGLRVGGGSFQHRGDQGLIEPAEFVGPGAVLQIAEHLDVPAAEGEHRLAFFQGHAKRPDRSWMDSIVSMKYENETPASLSQTAVVVSDGSQIPLIADDPQPGVGDALNDRKGLVGGLVVDDQHFKVISVLIQCGAHTFANKARVVVRRHADRHRGSLRIH